MQSNDLPMPQMIELEPTTYCNLKCRMCNVHHTKPDGRLFFDISLLEKLSWAEGCAIIIGSEFEPMIHRRIFDILYFFSDIGCKIEMITNGTLLNKKYRDMISNVNLFSVSFSFDGINKQTYEHMRVGSVFEKTMFNITETIGSLSERGITTHVNSVVTRSNMDQSNEILEFWNHHNVTKLSLLPMIVRDVNDFHINQCIFGVRHKFYSIMDDIALDVIKSNRRITVMTPYYYLTKIRDLYPERFKGATVISSHPEARTIPSRRQEIGLGPYPGMTNDCRSPFTHARITASGEVCLCHNRSIGNLAQHSFRDIWYGERANVLRKRILDVGDICKTCDYYRFCLKVNTTDPDDIRNYFDQSIISKISKESFVNPFLGNDE